MFQKQPTIKSQNVAKWFHVPCNCVSSVTWNWSKINKKKIKISQEPLKWDPFDVNTSHSASDIIFIDFIGSRPFVIWFHSWIRLQFRFAPLCLYCQPALSVLHIWFSATYYRKHDFISLSFSLAHQMIMNYNNTL